MLSVTEKYEKKENTITTKMKNNSFKKGFTTTIVAIT